MVSPVARTVPSLTWMLPVEDRHVLADVVGVWGHLESRGHLGDVRVEAVFAGGESASAGADVVGLCGQRGDLGFLVRLGLPLEFGEVANDRSRCVHASQDCLYADILQVEYYRIMTADLPDYVLDPSPLAMFTRLQRVGLHLERLQSEAMAEIDMTFADYTLLATLHREPAPHALPVSRLAELVLRPMGSITQVVDRLERSGLVHSTARCRGSPSRAHRADRGRCRHRRARRQGIPRLAREEVLAALSDADVARIDTAVTTLLLALEGPRV